MLEAMVQSETRDWVAFEQMRGPEAASTSGEAFFDKSARSTINGPTRGKTRDSTWGPPPPAPTNNRISSTASLSNRSTYSRSSSRNLLIPSSPSARRSSAGSRDLSFLAREGTKPDVVSNRSSSTTSNSTNESVNAKNRARSRDRSSSRGRDPSRAPSIPPESSSRGRSRGRSRDVVHTQQSSTGRPRSISVTSRSVENRHSQSERRSLSRPRDRSSSRTRTTIVTNAPADKKGRGRSCSRPRLPLTKQKSAPKVRSRSQSLTRVTCPSPSVAARVVGTSRPPSRGRSHREGFAGSPLAASDANIVVGRDISFGRVDQPVSSTEDEPLQKVRFMERLFGDQKIKKSRPDSAGFPENARPRTLLAATVYHNTATNLWITTINTNQRGVAKNPTLANKYLKAFSFSSEREARESAIANAPPKMIDFKESPNCFSCSGKFAVFRRASHCRNCGVCICTGCSTMWPSKMIPETYNLKNETFVKVCKSCDTLSTKFKQALLCGDYEQAIAIYGTGNVNLRTPFPVKNKKDEILYPVHCAVQGGNLDLVRWLIDGHFCPIKLIRTGAGKKTKRGIDALILTSKGRSVLTIALERLKVDVMRYLVVECGVSIYESTDLKASLRALEAALTSLPPTNSSRPFMEETFGMARWDRASFDEMSEPSSLGVDEELDVETIGTKSNRTKGSRGDSVSAENLYSI